MLLIEVQFRAEFAVGAVVLSTAPERHFMSYRNGDRSREHRLRKARIARREKIKQLREGAAKPTEPTKSIKSSQTK